MDKPIVHYRGEAVVFAIGGAAWLQPVDHPNHLEGHDVSNTKPVRTSAVLSHNPETGRIETKHTIYVPEGT